MAGKKKSSGDDGGKKKKVAKKKAAPDAAPAAKKAPSAKKKAPATKKAAAKKTPAAKEAPSSESTLPGLPFPLTSLPGAPLRRRLYGIADLEGHVVQEPRWELLGPFGDGLAAFRRDDLTGYVDRTGAEVIPARFFMGQRFQEGRAVVRVERGGKLGAIDATGAVVVPPEYDALEGPHQGAFTARKGDRWGLLDRDGRELLPLRYDRLYDWSEGHRVVELEGRFGLVDTTGRLVLPVEHPPLYDLTEGLLGCDLPGGPGYVDLAGQVVIPGPFDRLGPFREGLALVNVGGRFGYLKRDGAWLVEPSLGDVTPSYRDEPHPGWFHEGLAVYTDEEAPGHYEAAFGYLDRAGRRVTEAVFKYPHRLVEGRALVGADEGFGYLGPDGAWAIPPRFAAADDFHEGRARVTGEGGLFGYVDPSGAWVVEPRYEEAGHFSGGVATVKLDGRWGLIDRDGREVHPPRFDLIGIPAEGLAPVMAEGPDPEAEARELARVNAALGPVLDDLAPTVRPFLRLRLEPVTDAPLADDGWWEAERQVLGEGFLTASKLGGTPYVPEGADLPRDAGGAPLALLAQLDLGALPPLDGLPARGLLQVFVAADGCVDPDDLTSSDRVRVVFHEDPAAAPGAPPPDARRALPDFPVRCVARLSAELAAGPVTPDVPGFERALSAKSKKALGDERVRQGLYEVVQSTGHKLGGYPAFTQEDPRSEKRYKKYDTLLLQLDSDGTVEWGDAGIANVFVPAAALSAGDFSDVLFTSDSL